MCVGGGGGEGGKVWGGVVCIHMCFVGGGGGGMGIRSYYRFVQLHPKDVIQGDLPLWILEKSSQIVPFKRTFATIALCKMLGVDCVYVHVLCCSQQ